MTAAQLSPYFPRQPLPLLEQLLQLRHQPREFFFERFVVLLLLGRAHVPPRRQHEAVLPDALDVGRVAEPGHIRVLPGAVFVVIPPVRLRLAAPLPKGIDDPANVRVRQWIDDGARGRRLTVCIVPRLRASMKRVSLRRSRPPFLRFLPVLSRVRNQRQTGMPVV